MLKEPIPKESDLIDPKEYRKRRKLLFKKHGQLIKKIMELPIENKITWGSIVEENALKYSDKIAIKFEDTKLTYKEFNEWVNRYAHYFISSGLKKSDVVEIFLTNRPELLIIFTAISKIGAISSLINTDLRGSGLAYCLNKTPGKFIIIGSELIDAFTNVKSDLNLSKDQLLLFCPDRDSVKVPDEFIDLNKVVKNFPSNNPTFMDNVKTNDPIAYLFTSGTTGLPKAAITNHRKLVTQAYYFGQAVFELTPEDTVYVPLPFFHGTAIWLGWGPAFGGGAALALRRKFSVSHFWEDIRKFNATVFTYVGELCRYIMNQSPAPNDRNNPVRKIIGNGLRPEIWKAFKERFDIEFVCEIYGMSEGMGGGFANALNFDYTIGFSNAPNAIVKYDPEEEKPMRNEEGFMEKVNQGEPGLLLIPNTGNLKIPGYTDKEATEAKLFRNVFKNGDVWFNSGDLLRDIGCGHAQFVDRLGDTFRWKGHNVSTTEVEKILNVFNQVLFSSVYGVKIPSTEGRAGMAAIVLKTNIEEFDLRNLAANFRKNLAIYAVPIILRFKSSLSTTATFKLKF